MPTIHSANQLSVYGAPSSWCMDLSGRMQGQTSTGVDRSTSEENDQLSKQVDPQEVGSLVRNQPSSTRVSQRRTFSVRLEPWANASKRNDHQVSQWEGQRLRAETTNRCVQSRVKSTDRLQRFEMMNPDEQLRTVREEARFIRTVSNEM